ncbi:ACP phosphodiesterase [Rhodocyclaceae bacterium SMB388]
MNFLAHALLAGDDPADQLGGLIGDFVKGPLPAGLPPDVAAGVRLHRLIDVFADTHPAFRRSRARVSPTRRRVSGIMVDMFYDHFLARHWADFHDDPLEAFSARMYALMAEHDHLLPHRLAHQLPRMREGDWLVSYRSARTIELALDRMALRLRQPAALKGAGVELGLHYAALEADFRVFMRDAIDHARNCRTVLSESESRPAES